MEQLFTTLNNGRTMPMLGLGVYDMYNAEAEAAVTQALELGYRLIDTAAMYNNEREVGNAIRNCGVPRQELFITTKVSNSDHGYDAALRAFDTSARKINCDYIDLYLVHWPIKHGRRETWRALEQLYADGRVRAIGVSNYLIPFLDELATYANVVPVVNQVEFSPYLYLKDLLTTCHQRNIQLQAYSPLVRGQRMRDDKLVQVAQKYDRTPAQIILRWLLQRGVSAIPKSVSPQRLKENFGVFNFFIEADDMSYIDSFHENLRIVDDPSEMW